MATPSAADEAAAKAAVAHKIELLRAADAHGPVPHVALRKFRFLLLVTLGVGATSAALYPFLRGVTIEGGIFDVVGSSTHADARVELFQSIGGFVWAAVGLLLEEYFRLFIAAMLVYFANQAWYPGEVVTNGPGKFKRRMLFWFAPLAMYVVNVGISSIFVEHKLDKVVRAFTDDDLVSSSSRVSLAAAPLATTGNTTRTSVVDTVLRRLVTKGAEPFRINTTSTCASVVSNSSKTVKVTQNDTVILPSMLDLQSTFVSFGFPARPWNLAAMPMSLTPTHTVTVSRVKHNSTNRDEMQAKLDAFLAATGISYTTIGELLIQGQTLHGKATTDSNMFETYSCDPEVGSILEEPESDGSGSAESDLAAFKARARGLRLGAKRRARRLAQRRRLQSNSASGDDSATGDDEEEETSEEGSGDEEVEDEEDSNKVLADDAQVVNGMTVDEDGKPLCYGADNYLVDVADFHNASFQNVQSVFESIYGFGGINFTKIQVTLDTFTLSPQLNMTTVTIDMPFDDFAEYVWVDSDRCFVNNATFKDPEYERENMDEGEDFEAFQEYMCSGRYIAYDGPYQTCGERNCVVEDYSNVMFMTKQVQLTPYFKNCSIGPHNVTYDKDISSWFPANCSAQRDSAFLYGVGSYFEGDFQVRGGVKGPVITNPTRHYVLTFAKLEWRFEDLSARFGAKCDKDAGECQGLLHPLENIGPDSNGSRVLIVGENAIPKGFKRRTLRNPLPLVTLREPKLYENAGKYTYYMYEYVDMARMNSTYRESDGLGLAQGQCSVYIDAYLNHVQTNHYYIQDPRQPLYTAALYYLFQDAQVKTLTLPKNNTMGVLDLSQRVLGSTQLSGDLETKAIRYSVPLVSVISTCTGMLILIVYMAIILKFPRDAVKLSDQTNPAAQYADMLVEEYSERVHTRRLRLADGSLVEMDDYEVQRIVFRNIHKPEEPVVMDG